jgi:tetratricopeptide (TPR) repeat protein
MEVVKKGRAAATSPVLATALDLALAWQLGAADRSEDLVGVARRLEASDPQSATAFAIESSALDASGRYEEAIAGARARLDAHPGEPEAIRALGMSLALSGRIDEGLTEFRHVLDGRSPTSVDYNQLAWLGLLAGSNLERALADATKSTRKLPTSAGYHTLAAIQAERGHFAEASTSLAWCGWMRGRSEPVNDDFYVLGRIAERLGFADEAVSFYKRVPKSKSAIGTARLCERRLQALKTAP